MLKKNIYLVEFKQLFTILNEINNFLNYNIYEVDYKNYLVNQDIDSNNSLFDSNIATFEDDKGAFDQKDAEGFIKINALRLKLLAARNNKS